MPHNTVAVESIPEVATFQEAKRMLSTFKETNRNIFEEYELLVQQYNSKLEAADKVVRARKVTCGDWELYQQQTTYDVDALYDALGREQFLAVGGSLKTTTTRSLDKTKFNAAITRGDVPQKVVEVITSVSPKYHAPKPLAT